MRLPTIERTIAIRTDWSTGTYSEHVRVEMEPHYDGMIYRALCYTCEAPVAKYRKYLKVAMRDARAHHDYHVVANALDKEA